MTSLLGLDDLDLTRHPDQDDVRISRADSRPAATPVAIIGLSGRVGDAEDLDQFWSMLVRGEEGYRGLSTERRADVDAYLAARGVRQPIADDRYLGGTRLPSVAAFDHRFFGLSPQEARTIDPNQRIFLETSWAALEDSGYLSREIHGERVGVYVGLSSDFGEDYRAILQAVAPDAPEISVAGNIKSIIGSRIAYLLDLRGPSMLIDTACSSGLVAAYTAVRAIQGGECTMALAGAVKCDLLPIAAEGSGVGIKDIRDTESVDHHTRTFDRGCDGTSAAEGCFVFVLKALDRARRDGDTIHAVIMGGALNQDGASNGITAPNVAAQADLIEAALADAGVSANQISFIEAHGTATRLGDPIEISGIERAFSRQTTRRQFCGIGSIKTNIGHLDNASGLAGLAKLVLALKHRTLPASLNFAEPNPSIDFPQTPVYVNDRVVPWSAGDQQTLYAGINSFGLSGTNCHLVVRSADPVPAPVEATGCHLLPLSARDARGLRGLLERYRDFLDGTDVGLADLAHTASTGRLHHRFRVAFVFATRAELLELIGRFLEDGDITDDVSRGEFRLVLDGGEKRDPHDLTAAERDQLSFEAESLVAGPGNDRGTRRRLAALYVRGADVDWRRSAPAGVRRVPLPAYPFEPSRCWIDPDPGGRRGLVDGAEVLRTLDRDIVVCRIGPARFWELAEHRINGVSVLPGTGLIEMMVAAARRLDLGWPQWTLRDVVFESPLAVPDGEEAEVHILLRRDGATHDITVASKVAEGPWVRNATAALWPDAGAEPPAPLDVAGVRGRLHRRLTADDGLDRALGLDVGDRWTGSLLAGWADQDATELLYELELAPRYWPEISGYTLHPALLDTVVNAPSTLYDPERLYLPFRYRVLTIHRPLPARVLVHFRKRAESIDGKLYAFDVRVLDPDGGAVLTIDNYCIKSAVDLDVTGTGEYGYVQAYRRTSPPPASAPGEGTVLLCGRFGAALDGMVRELETAGYDCVHLVAASAGAVEAALGEHRRFAFGLLSSVGAAVPPSLAEGVVEPVEETLALLAAIVERRASFAHGLVALTRNALAVGDHEGVVDPGQAGVLGLVRVAALEYQALKLRCVDADGATTPDVLVAEALAAGRPAFLAYRDGRPHEAYLKKQAVPLRPAAAMPAPDDGAVVISGGTGELGTAVAQHLARQGTRRLVLLGSPTGTGTREAWAELERDLDVFEVERLDLGDAPAVERTIAAIRARHGRIAGVAHLAGRPGAGFLYTKSLEEFMAVYRPKAVGAVNLHEATRSDDLDYFVCFSSISSLLLDPGQSDYTAANLVLDSLVQLRRREHRPALSIQWPAWREIGIASRMGAADEEELFPPLDTAEAVALFQALMAWPAHPAVIMPGRMRKPAPGPAAESTRRAATATPHPVVLYGLDGVGELEQAVAEIWAATLGVTELDAHDDFGDLGGNSLLTSQMLKLYAERFPEVMDITDLFRFTTVADQARCVRERLGGPATGPGDDAVPVRDAAEGDIDRLLDLLEQGAITVDESQDLLQGLEVK